MNDRTLIITKTLKAPRENVWEAWTDPTHIAKWYGPEGFRTEIHAFDLREGGNYSLTMFSPAGEPHRLQGTFLTLKKPELLKMTWQWEHDDSKGMGALTTVTVELQETKDGTEMKLTHKLPNAESQKLHDMGWRSSFAKLDRQF